MHMLSSETILLIARKRQIFETFNKFVLFPKVSSYLGFNKSLREITSV